MRGRDETWTGVKRGINDAYYMQWSKERLIIMAHGRATLQVELYCLRVGFYSGGCAWLISGGRKVARTKEA